MVDADKRTALTAFIWWSSWSAVTNRPGQHVSYTNNWPHDPLVGNTPPSHLLLWTVFSVLFLIAGIALLGWHHARQREEAPPALPASDPLAMIRITPSMRATAKYFWLVIALFLTQILLGAITAHYQVEGQDAYGFALSNILPYSLSRTWHTQLAVLWIATAWLGMGLYIGPAISGHEPRFQRSRRQLPVHVPAHHRRRRVHRTVARRDAEARPGQELLVRPPGLGVRGPRPLLAVVPVRRPRRVAAARRPRAVARDPQGRRIEVDRRAAVPLHRLHRTVLRRRADVGRAHAPVDGRVLALVGRAPVGRGLLRGLRDRGDRVPLHAPRPAAREHRDRRRAVRNHRVPVGRRARDVAPPVLHRHADRSDRARRQLLRARSGAAGVHRLRGLSHLQARQRHAVDAALSLADHVLHRSGVLESGRRRDCSAS